MAIFLIILLLLLLVSIKFIVKDLKSRVVLYIFSVYWFGSLIVSTFSPYGLYKINTFTYVLLVFAAISFIAGMMSVPITQRQNGESGNYINLINTQLNKLLSSKILLIAYILASLFCLVFAQRAIYVAALQSHAEMMEQYELIFEGDNLSQNIFGFVITPLFHVMLLMLSFWAINIKEVGIKHFPQLVVFVVFFICYMLISGGRSVFIVALLYLLFVYIMTSDEEHLFKISLRRLLLIAVAIYIVNIGITAMNNYRNVGVLSLETEQLEEEDDVLASEFLVLYSELPLVLFDKALSHNYVQRYGGYKFGRATFTGIDSWVAWMLSHIGLGYNSTSVIVQDLQDNYVEYAPGRDANYAYTGLFYHYLDFGLLGVILFPFFFGRVYRYIIKMYYQTSKTTLLLLAALGFFMMMHSLFTCYFIKSWVYVYIATLLIISNKKRLLKA